MLYHAVWLLYDLGHLNSLLSWFFVAMSVWAIVRAFRFRRRGSRSRGGWWL